jgi:hypothetical protein
MVHVIHIDMPEGRRFFIDAQGIPRRLLDAPRMRVKRARRKVRKG